MFSARFFSSFFCYVLCQVLFQVFCCPGPLPNSLPGRRLFISGSLLGSFPFLPTSLGAAPLGQRCPRSPSPDALGSGGRWCGANRNQKLLGFPKPVGGSGIWNLNLPPNEPKGWCMDIRTSSGARLSEPGTGSYHVHHLLVLVKACSHALQN